ELEAESHRYLPKQRPDSDFSCLFGRRFFLLPWLQMPLHGSCPEPGLRKPLYPRYRAPEFPCTRQCQNSPRPEQGRRPPVAVCRIVFELAAAPKRLTLVFAPALLARPEREKRN